MEMIENVCRCDVPKLGPTEATKSDHVPKVSQDRLAAIPAPGWHRCPDNVGVMLC